MLTDPKQINEASVSSLFIRMLYNEEELATGSGFLVQVASVTYLVTNWHNLSGRDSLTKQCLHRQAALPNKVDIRHNKLGQLGAHVSRIEALLTPGGAPRWIEHPVFGDQVDVVALPLEALDGTIAYPMNLNGNSIMAPRSGGRVHVVGFPFGLLCTDSLAVWMTGHIASEPDLDFDGLPLFLVDCRTRKGSSGSPVVCHTNGGSVPTREGAAFVSGAMTEFLGIYSGRINEDSDIGKVWKASVVRELFDIRRP